MSSEEHSKFERDEGYRYAKLAMTWHGWGSPVGLGLFLLLAGMTLYFLHLASLIG